MLGSPASRKSSMTGSMNVRPPLAWLLDYDICSFLPQCFFFLTDPDLKRQKEVCFFHVSSLEVSGSLARSGSNCLPPPLWPLAAAGSRIRSLALLVFTVRSRGFATLSGEWTSYRAEIIKNYCLSASLEDSTKPGGSTNRY